MKKLSNRTGGYLPARILVVLMVLGTIGFRAQAQNGYYDQRQNGYDDQQQNGYYDQQQNGYYDQQQNGNYGNVSYQNFYDELAPYGQWMNDPQYGYVWMPRVGRGFRPYYTNGYWVMTDYGNMWMSNYQWGWAPFHYGRWAESNYYGWIWIPGNEWGPAWVNWRQGGGYYGWAPMGPGVSINISFGSGYSVPNPWWTFIPCANIYSRSLNTYYAPRRTVNIINNTTIINNTYVDNRSRNTYVTGPRRSEVETATRQRVPVYNVNNSTRTGAANVSGRNISIYRPSVVQNVGRGQNAASPRQVKNLDQSIINGRGGANVGRQSNTARNGNAANNQSNVNGREGLQVREVAPQNNGQRLQQIDRQGNQSDRSPSTVEPRTRQSQQQRMQVQQTDQQRAQQVQQQRMQVQQADQQVQQQRMQVQQQRAQQMQQQRTQAQQADQQRSQQIQQQRMQAQHADQQRSQQMQQQRMQAQQADQQRSQQMQQQRAQQQQQSQQRAQQVQQERSRQAQPRNIERDNVSPRSGNVERSARGR